MRESRPELPSQIPVDWAGVAAALVQHFGIREGIWRVALHFAPVVGLNANVNGKLMPTAMVAVSGVILVRDRHVSPLAVDAASVDQPRSGIVRPDGGPVECP